MKRAAIAKRVGKLRARLLPAPGNGVTLEEVCRTVWNADPNGFPELATGNMLGYFIPVFERESAFAEKRPSRL